MRAEPTRRSRLPASLLLGLLLLTSCTQGAAREPDSAPDGLERSSPQGVSVTSYVALGDSYTSAPFVPSTDLADGCFRSDGNYPSLLAEELGAQQFVDVSCAGADTADVTGPQATAGGRGTVPPQLRAVDADADLVTVGIGANDENVFARLAQGCATPDGRAGATDRCDVLMAEAVPVLNRMRGHVADVLRRVSRAAPEATVVLVGYPRLSAPDSPCPRLPVPEDVLGDLAVFEARLDRSLRGAADDAGTPYVDMHAASAGHEICSPHPWVNGSRTDDSRALAYHPLAAGQRAVAREVLELLGTRPPGGGR